MGGGGICRNYWRTTDVNEDYNMTKLMLTLQPASTSSVRPSPLHTASVYPRSSHNPMLCRSRGKPPLKSSKPRQGITQPRNCCKNMEDHLRRKEPAPTLLRRTNPTRRARLLRDNQERILCLPRRQIFLVEMGPFPFLVRLYRPLLVLGTSSARIRPPLLPQQYLHGRILLPP